MVIHNTHTDCTRNEFNCQSVPVLVCYTHAVVLTAKQYDSTLLLLSDVNQFSRLMTNSLIFNCSAMVALGQQNRLAH